MILFAHAELAKVLENPRQHSADASGSASGSEGTGLCRTNGFGGAATEYVHDDPRQVERGKRVPETGYSAVAAKASRWT